jgi:hypothetical protein
LAITLGEPHPEEGKWRAMNDLQFLEEMYEAGAAAYFDILSVNAFGMDLPPDDPPSPSTLNYARASLHREIMERHGDSGKAVWFNEYGWNAAPMSFPSDALTWQRVTEEQQAMYTLQGIEHAQQHWPWAGVFNIWYFRQVGDISPDDAGYYFRMVDVDFVPRRVYLAIKDKAAQLGEAGAGYYEETNSAVTISSGQWRGEIDARASGKAVLIGSTPGDSLTFTFSGRELQLVAWTGPGAGRLIATLDGENIAGLPTDERGRAYIELYAPQRAQETIPVVQGTNARRQTLRLTVSDVAHPESAGTSCSIDAFQVSAGSVQSFPVSSVVLLVGACVIVGGLLGRATIRPRETE